MHFGIIAAGDGSRLVQEGVAVHKPLVALQGRPMIERLIGEMIEAGAESVTIITNAKMPEVGAFLRELTLPVELTVIEKTTPSSMHSFYEISRMMENKGRFILTTVDTIFRPEPFRRYVKVFEAAPDSVAAMMGVTRFVDDEKPLYVAADNDMRITAFLDSPAADALFVSGGIYGLDTRCIRVLKQCVESGVSRMRNYQRALIQAGLDVRAFEFDKIVDVDHVSDIEGAEAFLAQD